MRKILMTLIVRAFLGYVFISFGDLSVFAQVPTPITPGETRTNSIGVVGELDRYSFAAAAGDHFTILMTSGSASLDVRVQLYAPDGTLVTENSGNPAAEIPNRLLPQTGNYQIVCRAASATATGNYALSLVKLPWPNLTDPNGGDIEPGEVKQGTIGLGDLDIFVFSGYAAERASILMTSQSGSLDVRLQLYAPDGTLVTNVTGNPSAEIPNHLLGQSGTYQVVCRAASPTATGNYSVSLSMVPINSNRVFLQIVGCESRTVNEGTLATLRAFASGPNVFYSLDPGAPEGAIINPASGVFTWTPSEVQGPGTYNV